MQAQEGFPVAKGVCCLLENTAAPLYIAQQMHLQSEILQATPFALMLGKPIA